MKAKLNLPPSQKSLVVWDVWAVHRSAELGAWLRENYPNILIDFVPGGCTGIGQPLDVGLNRPFKHAVKVAYHSWLVDTLLDQRRKGEKLDLHTGLPELRDASVGWIWEGYKAIKNKELILKAWEMCSIRGGRNLSFACMTSFETNERLINLKHDNPKLWNDLQTKSTREYCPGDDEEVAEDLAAHEDEEMGDDDAEIPTREVIQHVVTNRVRKGRQQKAKTSTSGVGLVSTGEAEDLDAEVAVEVPADAEAIPEGENKRKRRPNTRYES